MPTTGNLNQENATEGEPVVQDHRTSNTILETVASEPPDGTQRVSDYMSDNASLVSSTTLDVDPRTTRPVNDLQETGMSEQVQVIGMSEPVESTSSMVVSSDSLDGFGDSSFPSNVVAPKPSSLVGSSTSSSYNGFQNAFAAFASGTQRLKDSGFTDMTFSSGDIEESALESSVIEASSTASEVIGSTVETQVSCGIDSGVVTTSGECSMLTTGPQEMDTFSGSISAQQHMEVGDSVEPTPAVTETSSLSELVYVEPPAEVESMEVYDAEPPGEVDNTEQHEVDNTDPPGEEYHFEPDRQINDVETSAEVDDAQPSGEVDNTEPPGEVDNTEPPGEVDNTEPPGEVDNTEPHGEVDNTEPPGEVDNTELPGEVDNTEPPGEVDNTEPPGEVDNTEPHGEINNFRSDGQVNDIETSGEINDIEAFTEVTEAEQSVEMADVVSSAEMTDIEVSAETTAIEPPGMATIDSSAEMTNVNPSVNMASEEMVVPDPSTEAIGAMDDLGSSQELLLQSSQVAATAQETSMQDLGYSGQTTEVSESGLADQVQYGEPQAEDAAVTDSVYFIQMTDASGEIVTSIIDPNDIASYSDSVVYKQSMKADGQFETTVVSSGGMSVEQQQQPTAESTEPQPEEQQQVIYAHDLNGQLTPIDSAQSANDIAPPGKQFVYMQDSSGRIIRTIMDANQTMVPGQQVYYTQSEDGQIITSVMDSAAAGVAEDSAAQQTLQQPDQPDFSSLDHQPVVDEHPTGSAAAVSSVVGGTSGFAIDNSMSGLSMLAELSHLTAGQATTGLPEPRTTSSTDSSSQDMDEFRPVAMVTRRVVDSGEDGLEVVNSEVAGLRVGETEYDNADTAPQESAVSRIVSEMKGVLSPSLTVSKDNLFVQWQNLDAMCWMDVVLIMLVYSPTLRPLVNLEPTHELATTLLITLLKANRQAQVLLQNLLKKSSATAVTSFQTGAGNSVSLQDPKSSKLVCKENMDEIGKAINILYAMREKIWQALQPRLRCERGKHNSPVLVLPLLVREKPAIKQMFTMNYRYVFKCEKCGYSQDDAHTKILPSIPAVPLDFNMHSPCFVRNCFECQAPNQRMLMKFEGLQDFVQMHFVKGLPHNRFDELGFDFNSDRYEVTAVVHYKNNPDHFIAWVRNAPGAMWMECDDLKSVITRYLLVSPNIPPSQVHMVMWERRLSPQHTLIMRDTEDTKLLASLVLTVQQPTSSTSQQAGETAGGAQKTSAPPLPSSSSTTALATSQSTSSLLSGLMTQTQTFTPYTPTRGRGSRGGRAGRGGTRGRGSTRQRAPTTTVQLTSPTILQARPRTSPQILRLPLSALANSGLNVRGAATTSSSTGTRFVLVGGNNAQGTSASVSTSTGGTPNKVIMVRSQGGMGNISATQLLQLLQRSGAISQSGARITTTITSSGDTNQKDTFPNAASATPAILPGEEQLHPDQQMESEGTQMVGQCSSETAMDEGGAEMVESSSQVIQQPLAAQDQFESNFEASTAAAAAEPEGTSSSMMMSQESHMTGMSSTISSSTLSAQPEEPQPEPRTMGNIKTLTLNQPGTTAARYISIPNPSGSGNILTQLVMKGGKMVLVPVDKHTQVAQAAGTSVLKLPSTSQGSPTISIRVPGSGSQTVSIAPASEPTSAIQQLAPISASMPFSKVSSISAVTSSSITTTSSSTGLRYVTIPGTAGGKRTIQLISIPRGHSSAGGVGSSGQKTIIVGPGGVQTQVTSPSVVSTRLVSSADTTSTEGRVLSQTGNIVFRELRKEADSGNSLTGAVSSLGTGDVGVQSSPILNQYLLSSSDGATINTMTTAGADGGVANTRLVSTSAVSLLRDMSLRSTLGLAGTQGTMTPLSNLATSSAAQQKPLESFRYILPGSNTSQGILQSNIGGTGSSGKSFTALSSSGTIIGGQLTPVSPADPSTLDQEHAVTVIDDNEQTSAISLLTSPKRFGREVETIEYIPLGRGRSRGRGRGTRGRGGRTTARGRGRQKQEWSDADFVQTSSVPGRGTVSTLSELRQVGGHMIESNIEAIDGVPVVSIPEYTDATAQKESVSAAKSIAEEPVSMDHGNEQTSELPLMEQGEATSELGDALQGPRVITQTIPSIKANHGFDILTQGILGASGVVHPSSSSPKACRSLLTGAAASLPSFSPPSSSVSMESSVAFRTQHSLSMGGSVSQSEIETLIQAAAAAAKPGAGQTDTIKSLSSVVSGMTENENIDSIRESSSGLDTIENDGGIKGQTLAEAHMDADEERVVNVDESQVSAAERYRMPTELFQPDEESPEKPVRQEEGMSKQSSLAENELPAKLFQDADSSCLEERESSQTLPKMDDVESKESDSAAYLGSSLSSSAFPQEEDFGSTSHPPQDLGAPIVPGDDDTCVMDVDVETTEDSAAKLPVSGDSASRMLKKKPSKYSGQKRGRKKSKSLSVMEEEPRTEEQQARHTAEPAHSPCKGISSEKILEIASTLKKSSKSKDTVVQLSLKRTNVGGFATDLLRESEMEEQEEEAEVVEEGVAAEGGAAVEGGAVVEERASVEEGVVVEEGAASGEISVSDEGDTTVDILDVLKETEELPKAESELEETSLSPQREVCEKEDRRISIECPDYEQWTAFVRCPKVKVVWSEDNEEFLPSPFNYQVLASKIRKYSFRHSSLGPRQDSFTSAPPAFEPTRVKLETKVSPVQQAVVKRRTRKALERPMVDPSKEPVVIPLVTGDEGDPACTGGSVVTSPIDGEIFTGVIVRGKRERADWSSVLEEEEEESDSAEEVSDDKEFQNLYCLQLATVLFMQAGDFSSLSSEADDDWEGADEEVLDDAVPPEKSESVVAGSTQGDITLDEGESAAGQSAEVDLKIKGKQLKRRRESTESTSGGPVSKRSRIEQISDVPSPSSPDRGSLSLDNQSEKHLKRSEDPTTSGVVTCLNGISTAASPPSSTLESEWTGSESSSGQTLVSSSLTGFTSPARRSSRTHIPSKKVLDAQEDTLGRRRPSQASSEDDLSGYNSGDAGVKKGKKKKLTAVPS